MRKDNKSVYFLIIGITLIFLGLSISKSWYYTIHYPGTDLLARTIGSRLVLSEHSPYYYLGSKEDDYYANPLTKIEDGRIVNGNVATPATLLLVKPLSQLPYYIIRPVWTIIQFVLLFLSLYLLTFAQKYDPKNTFLPLTLILIAFVCSNNWHFNIAAGQIYVFYLFLWSLIFFFYKKENNRSKFLAGLLSGISFAFRPLMIVTAIIFILRKDYKTLAAFTIGLIASFSIFMIPANRNLLPDYINAMGEYNQEMFNETKKNIPVLSDTNSFEGVKHITSAHAFHTGALKNLSSYAYDNFHLRISTTSLLFSFLAICIALAIPLYWRTNKPLSIEDLFLFAFFLYMLAELFVPGSRSGYNFIQWIFPVYLIALKNRGNVFVLIILFLALFLQHGEPFSFPFQFELSELLLLLLSFYLVFFKRKETLTID